MYHRVMQKELEQAAKKLPIVTILGPRQSGKTTLVQQTFPDKPYVNMESIHIREFVKNDPIRFLEQYPVCAYLYRTRHPNALASS